MLFVSNKMMKVMGIERKRIGLFTCFMIILMSSTYGQLPTMEIKITPESQAITEANYTVTKPPPPPLEGANVTKSVHTLKPHPTSHNHSSHNHTDHTDDAKIRRAGIIISAVVIAISMATIVLAAFYWLYFDKQEDDQQSISSHRTADRNDLNREIKNAAIKSLQQNKAPQLPGTTTEREKSRSTSSSASSKKQQPNESSASSSKKRKQTEQSSSKSSKKPVEEKNVNIEPPAPIESKDNQPEKSNSAFPSKQKLPNVEPSNTQSQMPFSVLSAPSVTSKNDE
uniref:Uncharacterized protein LOC113793126 n=1 Tax=Dermatophagoides pteronyssinus TaxID=6956 RepID=A0A6P6Y1D0_DERPT|nr:uncharacterized protein LOC113793126 [Dermatophagoides pteronyssinus]